MSMHIRQMRKPHIRLLTDTTNEKKSPTELHIYEKGKQQQYRIIKFYDAKRYRSRVLTDL